MKDLEELADLKPKVEQVRLKENFCKQNFQNDTNEPFEPNTNTLYKTDEKLVEDSKCTNTAIENVNIYLPGPSNALANTKKNQKAIKPLRETKKYI